MTKAEITEWLKEKTNPSLYRHSTATREFAAELADIYHVETIMRNIPNKRMPKKNSPTNESGKLDTTMNCEYIVVMQKKS